MSAIEPIRSRLSKYVSREVVPLYPALLFLAVFLGLPLGYIVVISFYQFDPIEIVGSSITVENYTRLVMDSFYRQFIFYTIRLALIVTFFCLLLGYPIAHLLTRVSDNVRNLLLFLIVLPLMVGTVVRTYAWILLLGSQGVVNELLLWTLGRQFTLLGTTNAVIIGLIGVLLPFIVLPIYSSLESMDESLEPAARNLGANKFQAFYKVTLPLSLPGVMTGSIFVFALSMSAVVTPNLLGGRRDLTLGALMYDTALSDTNWPFASAMAVLIGVITLGMILSYLWFFRDRIGGAQ